MPVVKNNLKSKLKLVSIVGVDEDSKNVLKSKTFSNVKAAVENETLYNIGLVISDLQTYELSNIVRLDEFELLDEI